MGIRAWASAALVLSWGLMVCLVLSREWGNGLWGLLLGIM